MERQGQSLRDQRFPEVLLWYKHTKYPYWPALVQQRSKNIFRVKFLGWSHVQKTGIQVSKRGLDARSLSFTDMSRQRRAELLAAGRNSSLGKVFERALRIADAFNSEELSGNSVCSRARSLRTAQSATVLTVPNAGPDIHTAAPDSGPGSLAADGEPGRLTAHAGPGSLATDGEPGRLTAHAGPGSLAAHAGPDSLAAGVGPRSLAAGVGPRSFAAHVEPGRLAAHVVPGRLSAYAGPGSLAVDAGPGKLTAKAEPRNLATITLADIGPSSLAADAGPGLGMPAAKCGSADDVLPADDEGFARKTSSCASNTGHDKQRRSPELLPHCSYDGASSTSSDELPSFLEDDGTPVEYGKDMLVWFKHTKDPYWPAVITSFSRARLSVKFVEYSTADGRGISLQRKRAMKRLLEYPGRRYAEFVAAGRRWKHADVFDKAVQRADDYVRQRALEIVVCGPTEYLLDSALPPKVQNAAVCDMAESSAPSMVEEGREEEEVEENDVSTESSRRCSFVFNYSSETLKVIKDRTEASATLVDYLLAQKTKLNKHLTNIDMGKLHSTFRSDFLQGDSKKMVARRGPVDDEEQYTTLVNYLLEMYKKISPQCILPRAVDTVLFVLVPEAVMYALRETQQLSSDEAQAVFLRGIEFTAEERRARLESMEFSLRNQTDEEKQAHAERQQAMLDRYYSQLQNSS